MLHFSKLLAMTKPSKEKRQTLIAPIAVEILTLRLVNFRWISAFIRNGRLQRKAGLNWIRSEK